MLELPLSHDAVGNFLLPCYQLALSAEHANPVRLACVRHAASVRPEPGSNPQINYLSIVPGQALAQPGTPCPVTL